MKKLILLTFLIPSFVFSQDVNKNREMMMQSNNLKNLSPKSEGPKKGGSTIKTSPFLTSSDFTLLQNPTFEGGFRNSLALGFGRTSLTGKYGYGGNGFLTTDGSQKGLSGFGTVKNNNFSISLAEIASSRSISFSYMKIYSGKFSKGFGINLGRTNSQTSDTTPPMKTLAPSVMFFGGYDLNLNRWIISPELLLSYSFIYRDLGMKVWRQDPTFNAFVGVGFGYKISKRFTLVTAYRGNINTNPKFGLMNNILIGNKFNF